MRRVDRAGAREGKKSLRKNKKSIQETLKNGGKGDFSTTDLTSKPAPRLKPRVNPLSMIDGGCNLVGRGFVNDRDRVIQRSVSSGVEAIIIVTNDLGKQEEALELTNANEGCLYTCVGVHPDNIKRTNDRLFTQRLDKMQEMSLHPSVVGVYCGLDLSREVSMHYPQEKMLLSQFELASSAKLPLVIMDVSATEKIVEKLKEMHSILEDTKVAIYNFCGEEQDFQHYMKLESPAIYFMISGVCTENGSKGELARGFLPRIPRDRLLLITDSPKHTPQNIEDSYILEQKNEPSNLPYVYRKAAEVMGIAVPELVAIVYTNTKTFFNLKDHDEVAEEEPDPTKAAEAGDEKADGKIEEEEEEDEDDEEEEEKDYSKVKQEKRDQKKQESNNTTNQKSQPTATTTQTTQTTTPPPTEAPTVETTTTADPETPPVDRNARYACMMCRQVLLSAPHVIPHEQGLDSIKFLQRARNDIEFDSSNVLFVKELNWLKLASEQDRIDAGEFVTSGNISCPECSAKIGKWHISPEYEGEGGSDETVYVLVKKRVDVIIPKMDAQMMADYAQEYEFGSKERQHQTQNQKKKKQQKKNTKQNNRSNMGNFRNKSFLSNASKQKKPGMEDDDDE